MWRRRLWFAGAGALVAWVALPLPRSFSIPAVVSPAEDQAVYVPMDGVLSRVTVRRGDAVRAGQSLLEISSTELETRRRTLELEEEILLARRDLAAGDERLKTQLREIAESLARARAELAMAREEKRQSVVRARFDGTVLEWDGERREGQAVEGDLLIGRIADPRRRRLLGYLGEIHRTDLEPGARARFYPAGGGPGLDGTVSAIRPTPLHELPHAAVTTVGGGEIAVTRGPHGRLEPLAAFYEVEVRLDDDAPAAAFGASGALRLSGRPRSLLARMLKHAWTVLVRETGF